MKTIIQIVSSNYKGGIKMENLKECLRCLVMARIDYIDINYPIRKQ